MTLNKVIDDKSLIDRIKTLESIQDIIKLKSVYCRYCDSDNEKKNREDNPHIVDFLLHL